MLSLALKIVLGLSSINGSLTFDSLAHQESLPAAQQTTTVTSTNAGGQGTQISRMVTTTSQVPTVQPPSQTQIRYFMNSQQQSQLVTVQVTNMKGVDVLRLLVTRYQVNLVFAEAGVPDIAVTTNIVDMPLEDALIAVSSVMGGYFTNINGIYAFHRGEAPATRAGVLRAESRRVAFGGFGDSSFQMTPPAFAGVAQPPMPSVSFVPQVRTGTIQISPQSSQFLSPHVDRAAEARIAPRLRTQTYTATIRESGQGHNLTITRAYPSQLRYSLTNSYTGASNFPALVKSLTPHQKNLMKKRGYLKLSDLNARQLRLVGTVKGLRELKYSGTSGGSITIKG